MPKVKKSGTFTVTCGYCRSRVEYAFDETKVDDDGDRHVPCPACGEDIPHVPPTPKTPDRPSQPRP